MNHSSSVVRRSEELSRAFILPRGPDGPSTTRRPSSIGLPLSFATFSRVVKALSTCPLVTWYRADSGSHCKKAQRMFRFGFVDAVDQCYTTHRCNTREHKQWKRRQSEQPSPSQCWSNNKSQCHFKTCSQRPKTLKTKAIPFNFETNDKI